MGLTNERTRCGANYQELASGIGGRLFLRLTSMGPSASGRDQRCIARPDSIVGLSRYCLGGWSGLEGFAGGKRIFQAMFRAEKDRR